MTISLNKKGTKKMEIKIIDTCIELLSNRLAEDREDIEQHSGSEDELDKILCEVYTGEIAKLEICIEALEEERKGLIANERKK